MKLFDAHCHLQDPRIFNKAPQLIDAAMNSGVIRFAVNGVSENDWHLVKQMSESFPSIVPSFGLHPWYVLKRTPNWLENLRGYLEAAPLAAVGEIGLDKSSRGREISFADQVEVFQQQLELANELKRPASIHCVRAFGDLLQIMKSMGPFPSGFILHSYLGSAEMVPEFAKLGAFFSFSGFLMSMKETKAKKMLKMVPPDRILLETDAPDALPTTNIDSLFLVEGDPSQASNSLSHAAKYISTLPRDTLNHPANIHNQSCFSLFWFINSFIHLVSLEANF